MTRRSFVEKVALAAGITAAGGALFETQTPGTAEASNVTPPPLNGEAMMNAGGFGWNLQSDSAMEA